MTRVWTGLGAAAAVVGLGAGCPAPDDCTDVDFASVEVTVVDGDGVPIAGASVSYAVDGAAAEACEAAGDGFVCGWETAGAFEISASASGYEGTTEAITVAGDECHVQTEALDIVLEPMQSAR